MLANSGRFTVPISILTTISESSFPCDHSFIDQVREFFDWSHAAKLFANTAPLGYLHEIDAMSGRGGHSSRRFVRLVVKNDDAQVRRVCERLCRPEQPN